MTPPEPVTSPDPMLDYLWTCYLAVPPQAADAVLTVLAEAVALARAVTDDDVARLAIVAAWTNYQLLQTQSQDLVQHWVGHIADSATIAAGDALAERIPSGIDTLTES